MRIPVNKNQWNRGAIVKLIRRGLRNSRKDHRKRWNKIRVRLGMGPLNMPPDNTTFDDDELYSWFMREVARLDLKRLKKTEYQQCHYYIVSFDHIIPKDYFEKTAYGFKMSWNIKNLSLMAPKVNSLKSNTVDFGEIERRGILHLMPRDLIELYVAFY